MCESKENGGMPGKVEDGEILKTGTRNTEYLWLDGQKCNNFST